MPLEPAQPSLAMPAPKCLCGTDCIPVTSVMQLVWARWEGQCWFRADGVSYWQYRLPCHLAAYPFDKQSRNGSSAPGRALTGQSPGRFAGSCWRLVSGDFWPITSGGLAPKSSQQCGPTAAGRGAFTTTHVSRPYQAQAPRFQWQAWKEPARQSSIAAR